jgi:hypothetical protein
MLSSIVTPAAHAAVNINRESDENPMREVAKSIMWGAIGGFMVGGAIALATDDTSKDDDYIRYGIVGGTFVGLGMGLWFVSRGLRARRSSRCRAASCARTSCRPSRRMASCGSRW